MAHLEEGAVTIDNNIGGEERFGFIYCAGREHARRGRWGFGEVVRFR
jgi:hypothetical protein